MEAALLADRVSSSRIRPALLANWLFAVAGLIILIVAVGGITRLTESGLSITEWKPVTGTIPPLSEEQWKAEFAAYQQIGEYLHIAGPAGMTLDDYKFIYFWEWFHRIVARFIGIAYAVPLAWFWIKGAIPQGYKPRLVLLLALGGLQGLFGWLMVKSGLNQDATSVSHFWLSIHLLTALTTLALIVWTALDMRQLARKGHDARRSRLTALSAITAVILFVQLLLGAWVAGLRAGLASDSWPLMQGQFFPTVNWQNGAFWAFTHDPFLLHFLHRWWAWVAVAALIVLARKARAAGNRPASIAIHSTFGIQIILGIVTVWTGVALWAGVAHQLVGALLVAAVAWGGHAAGQARA